MNKKTNCIMLLCAFFSGIASAELNVDFSRGKWDESQWIVVKSPRLDYCRGFTQRDGWIENICPDLSAKEIFEKHNNAVYSGMVYKDKFKIGCTVSSRMGFDYRMAPLIVIAPELGKSGDGKSEFREHWEIVLYDLGLNVWHHYMTEDGKPAWYKAASLLLKPEDIYKPNIRHNLQVKISKNRKGRKEMVVTCGDYVLQYANDNLPEEFYAGVLGCEGRNMFYDFVVKSK
ncbi:MAG: hypothetical protein IIW14_09730 [Kiritimatiellae bacterium]|nr:hypothetical protein [Kiritimatiellia bacterium]